MRFSVCLTLAAAAVMCLCPAALAQRPGGGRQGGGFGGGGAGANRLALLRIEAVQKELELTPEQVTAIQKLQEELRPQREGQRGEGQRGEGQRGRRRGEGNRRPEGNNDQTRLDGSVDRFFVQAQENQPRRPMISDEDRARFRQQAEERAKQEREKLGEILLPHQVKRLNEIYLQVRGTAALSDPDVASELGLTDEQKANLTKARDEAREASQGDLRELFQSGDRERIQAKMAELRKASDDKVLAVLTADQRAKWEALQGKKFDLPADALRGGPGGRGPGQRGGNRPANTET